MQVKRPSTLLLGLASGMSPFGMALVVPTLELFAQKFNAPYSSIQFILSAYVFGIAVSYTHLRAHETRSNLVCRLLLEKKKK